jgi:hypothetical protein
VAQLSRFWFRLAEFIVWMAAPSFRGSNSNSRNEYGNWRRIKPAAQILGDCREAAIHAAWKQI